MQTSAGWCGESLCTPFKPRSQPNSNANAARRESLESARPSLEAPRCERAVSCSALPQVRLGRGNRQQKGHSEQFSSAVSALALAVRDVDLKDLAPEDCLEFVETAQQRLSAAEKKKIEQDRVLLELAWNKRRRVEPKRRNEAGQEQRQRQGRQHSLPQEDKESESPEQQRALLVAQWQENKRSLPEQKRRNASSRSHSSRRARRRSQPVVTSAAQRIRTQQNHGAQPSRSSSQPMSHSPDEQLLEMLRLQLTGSRPGGQVHGFIESLGKAPVLTKQQEAGLATIIRRGTLLGQAQSRLEDELGREPSPEELAAETGCPPEEYAKAASLAAEGRQLMMRYNLRLVYSIAKQHQNRGLDMDDMLPEGVIGLERAIDKFEPEKGFRFSTYSHWWIRQHIHRALVESRIIRLPVNVVDNIARVTRARRKLGAQENRKGKVTDEELSSVLGLPLAKVKQLTQLSQPIRSLDVPLWVDDDCPEPLHERVASDKGPASEDAALAADALNMVEDDMTALLQTLPVRERNVIRWRYGLWPDGKSMGLNEVGVAYGLTQERIRQIEESGLARLRERSPAHFKNWVPS